MKKIKLNSYIYMFIYCIISAIIQAIAYVSFVEIGGFYPGGISGIIRLGIDISNSFFNIYLNYSLLYFLFNLVIAIFVFKHIGKKFTIFSLLQTGLTSLFILFFKPMFTVDDPILLAIFGGIINGLGSGIALMKNFSTGGLDFISIYMSIKKNKSTWNTVLFINAFVICCAGILFKWETALYSIIYQYTSTQIIKYLHKRYTHDTITIITTKPDEVANKILSCIRHGITITKATGAFRHQEEDVLYTVVNTFQTNTVIQAAKEADPKVFINVQNSKQVIGNYYQQPLE